MSVDLETPPPVTRRRKTIKRAAPTRFPVAERTTPREALPPLPEDQIPEHIKAWTIHRHVFDRCQQRGIHILEAMTAIAEPEWTQPDPKYPGRVAYFRGDIQVSADPTAGAILTVIDLDEDLRTGRREPLQPTGVQGMARMTVAQRADQEALDILWVTTPTPVKNAEYRRVFVTPAVAEAMLSLNTHNRDVTRANVKYFRAQIEAGELADTHQGMAIDADGVYQDGQHRCLAIIETGQGQYQWILRGANPRHFPKIDTGRNRNYADVLGLAGEPDPAVLGSTVRLTYLYNWREYSQWRNRVTNEEVLKTLDENRAELMEAMRIGRRFRTAGRVPLTRTAVAAAFFSIVRAGTKASMVEKWFDDLANQTNIPGGDPRHKLTRLAHNNDKERKRGDGAYQLAVIIKTWNAWSEAKTVQNLGWSKLEQVPKANRATGAGR